MLLSRPILKDSKASKPPALEMEKLSYFSAA